MDIARKLILTLKRAMEDKDRLLKVYLKSHLPADQGKYLNACKTYHSTLRKIRNFK